MGRLDLLTSVPNSGFIKSSNNRRCRTVSICLGRVAAGWRYPPHFNTRIDVHLHRLDLMAQLSRFGPAKEE